jgi:ankyrin repeat protein
LSTASWSVAFIRVLPGLALLPALALGADPPIVDAARNGDLAALRTLVERGEDVDAPEGDGTTALLWTSYRDDIEGTNLLIRAGPLQ